MNIFFENNEYKFSRSEGIPTYFNVLYINKRLYLNLIYYWVFVLYC